MEKFFGEFRKFIMRGNVVDMAVGIIVGSSFTAIVNGLSNNILKPLVNWILTLIFDVDFPSEIYTVLKPVYTVDPETGERVIDALTGEPILDLTQTIYIDWGAFINAVISFFLIAFVLFCLVKLINKLREEHMEMVENIRKKRPSREDRKQMKARGIKLCDKAAVEEYYAEKARVAAEAKRAAEEQAQADRLAHPSTEELLMQIRDLLQRNA